MKKEVISQKEALQMALEMVEFHYADKTSSTSGESVELDEYVCLHQNNLGNVEADTYSSFEVSGIETDDVRLDFPGDPQHGTKVLYYWNVGELLAQYFELKRKSN